LPFAVGSFWEESFVLYADFADAAFFSFSGSFSETALALLGVDRAGFDLPLEAK